VIRSGDKSAPVRSRERSNGLDRFLPAYAYCERVARERRGAGRGHGAAGPKKPCLKQLAIERDMHYFIDVAGITEEEKRVV